MDALVVTYGLGVPPAEHAELQSELAPAIDAVPGLVSRTPLENRDTGVFGAFYVFESRAAFDRFVASELYGATYGAPRTTGVTASDFSIPTAWPRVACRSTAWRASPRKSCPRSVRSPRAAESSRAPPGRRTGRRWPGRCARGVWVGEVGTAYGPTGPACELRKRLVIPGGSKPDWEPARP